MERHTDNIQDLSGNAVSAVTVTVRRVSDNALASLFSDTLPSPTVKANPFTNDSDGELFFYALNNRYNIELSGAVTETREDVLLFDQDDTLLRRNILEIVASGSISQGDLALVDVTGGAISIQLPSDPGALVQFSDIVIQHLAGDITANNITIDRNGELIGGVAADVVMDLTDQRAVLVWGGSTLGWAIDLSQSATIPAIAFNDLSDVTIAAPDNFSVLYKSAGDWLNTNALLVEPGTAVTSDENLLIVGASTRYISIQATGASDFRITEVEGTPDTVTFGMLGQNPGLTLTDTEITTLGNIGSGSGRTIIGMGLNDRVEFFSTTNELRIQWDGSDFDLESRVNGAVLGFRATQGGGAVVDLVEMNPSGSIRVFRDLQLDGDIDHDGSQIGYFGTTPANITAAYVQTFSTASRTHAVPTAATLTDSTGGAANQTVVAVPAINGSGATTAQEAAIDDNFADVTDEINKLITDLANVKEIVNSIIDDRQTYGDFQ